MKALLLSPRGAARNTQDLIIRDVLEELADNLILIGDDIEFVPHLGLLTIASHFPPEWELTYLEEEYLPWDQAEPIIFAQNYDLVLLTGYDPQAERAYQLASRFRERGIRTVMGGHHASLLPQEAGQFVDSVVIGEGEPVIPRLLADFSAGRLQPRYRAEKPYDLTLAPPPRFDLLPDLSLYNKIPLIATRGCPYHCEFCCFPALYGPTFRHKTAGQVVNEIKLVQKLKTRPYFSFSDENLLADHRFAKELLKALIPLQIQWECYCDIGIAEDEELLRLLEASGCRLVQVGLETIDPGTLKPLEPWKAARAAHYREAIKKIQEYLPLMGMFIAGLDGDTPQIFSQLRDFILENRLTEMDFAVLTPMPGTPLFERLEREGRILSRDWQRYNWYQANFQPRGMTPQELEEGILWLFQEFTRRAAQRCRKKGVAPRAAHLERER